jgi:hypothetical protein
MEKPKPPNQNQKKSKIKKSKIQNNSEYSFTKPNISNTISNKSIETIQKENSQNLNYIDTTIYDNPDYYGVLPGIPYINGFEAYSNPHLINPFTHKIPIKTLRNNEYIYVNSKQYSRILKRREARKKFYNDNEDFLLCKKVKYHHESRHKHAMNRKRGKGGRFLSKDDIDLLYEKNKELNDNYIKNCIFVNGNLNDE